MKLANVPEQLKEDFALCMKHYLCTREEAIYERDRLMSSLTAQYQASICFSAIAESIRKKRK